MAKKIIPSASLDRVSSGNTAVLKLDTGPTYEKIRFAITSVLGGLDANDIESIKVVINGTTRIEYTSLQRLIDLNSFYGRSVDTVSPNLIDVVLPFFGSQFDNLADGLTLGVGTQGLESVNIEIKIAAGAPADIAIAADLLIDTVPQPLGAFLAVRSYGVSSSVTGDVQVRDLPKGGALYTALHLFKSDISKVVLKANQVEVINAKKSALERFQKDSWPFARVPVSARATHIDFLHYGNSGDLFNTKDVTSLQLTATFDTVGSLDVVTEIIESL